MAKIRLKSIPAYYNGNKSKPNPEKTTQESPTLPYQKEQSIGGSQTDERNLPVCSPDPKPITLHIEKKKKESTIKSKLMKSMIRQRYRERKSNNINDWIRDVTITSNSTHGQKFYVPEALLKRNTTCPKDEDWTVDDNDRLLLSPICAYCWGFGHYNHNCRSKKGLFDPMATCRDCGERGHSYKFCHQGLSRVQCELCTRWGHLTENCPRQQGLWEDTEDDEKNNPYNFRDMRGNNRVPCTAKSLWVWSGGNPGALHELHSNSVFHKRVMKNRKKLDKENLQKRKDTHVASTYDEWWEDYENVFTTRYFILHYQHTAPPLLPAHKRSITHYITCVEKQDIPTYSKIQEPPSHSSPHQKQPLSSKSMPILTDESPDQSEMEQDSGQALNVGLPQKRETVTLSFTAYKSSDAHPSDEDSDAYNSFSGNNTEFGTYSPITSAEAPILQSSTEAIIKHNSTDTSTPQNAGTEINIMKRNKTNNSNVDVTNIVTSKRRRTNRKLESSLSVPITRKRISSTLTTQTTKSRPIPRVSHTKGNSDRFYCMHCSKRIARSQRSKHQYSKRHIRNVSKAKRVDLIELIKTRDKCEHCDKVFRAPSEYKRHDVESCKKNKTKTKKKESIMKLAERLQSEDEPIKAKPKTNGR